MELSETLTAPLRRGEISTFGRRQSALATNFLNARTALLIAILIAVVHAFLAVTAVNTKSPTFDEPQHLTAGFSYWARNDFRLDPENGNLPARWAALPLLFGDLKFVSPNDPHWQRADGGATAHKFFYELSNDSDRMIAQARIMMSIFGVALCLLVYRIGREFFGAIGGLIAEMLTAFDPNFLAHSALVTADVAAAFFFTATIWSCWQLSQRISAARLAIAALSLSGLFLTKFSAPIVLPVLGLILVLQIVSKRETALRFGRFQADIAEKWKKAGLIGATWVILGLTVFFAIWLLFSFRYSAWTDNIPNHDDDAWRWSYVLEDRGTFEGAVSFGREHHLLPEAYLYGLAYVHKHEGDRPAFLDNQWSLIGFASFFPRAFLYKTPLPVLCLIALVIWAAIARRRHWTLERLLNPFAIFVLIYLAFAVGSSLNIGHRHILPIYPALFVGCGAIAYLLQKNSRTIVAGAVAILLLWQVSESFAVRPNYLAYFNQIAGGPRNGYQHLVDSSLDWGQDLPALKWWVDRHSSAPMAKPLYLAYFGSADPKSEGIDAKTLPENHSTGNMTFAPLRGGIYCISATTLQSVYARENGRWSVPYEQKYQTALSEIQRYRSTASDPTARASLIARDGALNWGKKIHIFERLRFERLCAYLRHRAPDAQVGYSILVFDLGDEDVDQALYGAPAELTPDVCVAGY
jgi:Dolichyl-phosphate-mannose-protein mannosyltransferase